MIGCYNTTASITKKLNGVIIENPTPFNFDGIFLEWTPTSINSSKADILLEQTVIVETCMKKKIPLTIFDTNISMKKNEIEWFKKSHVKLFEPSVLPRNGFQYLPHWMTIKTLQDIQLNDDNEKRINLGYIGPISDRLKSFDKYIVSSKILNSDIVIKYMTDSILTEKELEYSNLNIIPEKIYYYNTEYTVILGTERDYMNGHLNKSFINALENNCIPFVPEEQRYYRGLSSIVDNPWTKYYYNMYKNIYIGILKDIYESIDKFYPEMKINHTVDVIKRSFDV